MEYNILSKELSEYSSAGLRGAYNLAQSKGRGLKDVEGNIINLNPENSVKYEEESPDEKRSRVPLYLPSIAGLAPSVNHGNVGGNAGFLNYQKPFITIVQNRPIGTEDLNKYIGLPLEAKRVLGNMSGYTEVSNIFLPSSSNTLLKNEEKELRELLSTGVIL